MSQETDYHKFEKCMNKYVTSLEIAHKLFSIRQSGNVLEQMRELFYHFPEWRRKLTHMEISWLLGVRARETITKYMVKFNKEDV